MLVMRAHPLQRAYRYAPKVTERLNLTTPSLRVTSTDWASYPILTFPDVPKLDIALIDRRHERPLGVGEAATAPVAAAVGNAIFDATGARLRQAPFTPARVKAALDERAT
jgi:CO/xanthine dehydrogenase Mo-binding subunit